MATRFSKVKVYSNWCEYDQLDGVNFQDGERIEVKWPDGHLEKVRVILEVYNDHTTEQGGPINGTVIPMRKAFFKSKIRGMSLKVALDDSKLSVRRI